MKAATIIAKILTVLATVAGAIYLLATYGDKIVAWCKGLIAPKAEEVKAEEEAVEAEETEETEETVEEAAEEAVEEAAEAVEEIVEEVVEAVEDVVADETDFEG